MTPPEIAALVRHLSPEVRAAAYRELYRVYIEHSTVLAQIYNHRVRDWQAEMIELRHFAEPISARNIMNDYRTLFYTYSYSFGQLLVMALFQRYRSEGKAFKPKYLKILSYGGSASPTAILAEASIDISSGAFWQGGFDLIASWVD